MKDQPLQVKLEGDELVIRIGLDTLVYAAERNPYFYDDSKHSRSETYVKVGNTSDFLEDVIAALQDEKEDGSTPVSDLLDQAVVDAHDNGSLGFRD